MQDQGLSVRHSQPYHTTPPGDGTMFYRLWPELLYSHPKSSILLAPLLAFEGSEQVLPAKCL